MMTKDDKDYLNERFDAFGKLINAHFQNLDDRLDRIELQTTKTNGRVNELERKELTHIQNCPQTAKIEKINEDLSEYKMFKKYPKIGIGIIAAAVIIFVLTTFESIEKLKTASSKENIEILKEVGSQANDTLNIF